MVAPRYCSRGTPLVSTRVGCFHETLWYFFVHGVLQVGRLAQQAGVQVLIRGTSTLRNLENYHKLMGKKQGTYLKSYGAFMKVSVLCRGVLPRESQFLATRAARQPKTSLTHRTHQIAPANFL